jgi:hypothetical protein
MQIEIEREEDGRWLTEIPGLPGVMAYGQTQAEALAKVKALTLRVMADSGHPATPAWVWRLAPGFANAPKP